VEDPLSLTLNRADFQAMQRMLGPKLIAVGWLSFKTKFPLGCGAGRSYAARHLKAKGELQTAMEHYVWFSACSAWGRAGSWSHQIHPNPPQLIRNMEALHGLTVSLTMFYQLVAGFDDPNDVGTYFSNRGPWLAEVPSHHWDHRWIHCCWVRWLRWSIGPEA
jgi:hypothetical protein